MALIRSGLDVTGVAHVQGGTVNEVLLATVGAGLRELRHARGECVEDLALRAVVPVSLHHEEPGQARGNLDGVMIVPLPISEADVGLVTRCLAIASSSRRSSGLLPGSDL
jgi:diacylglycerol O-acyltransferase